MKQLMLAGAAFLAIGVLDRPAEAVPVDFTYTGTLVTFIVPSTGEYQILAFGAQGGDSGTIINPFGQAFVGAGGLGAEIGGDFNLTADEILQIAVGGVGTVGGTPTLGSPGGGGGGGGTFVVGPANTPLVIAGAGGGGGLVFIDTDFGAPGQGGLTGPNGGGSGGGTAGNGGSGAMAGGSGGGGGFFSAGTNGQFSGAGGGDAFPGLAGGVGVFGGGNGGFGGGGSGDTQAGGCGGGGGGYSGGAGVRGGLSGCGGGGGGGSFDAGTDQILVADFQSGNGEVVITELAAAVPEPTAIALLGMGLVGIAAIWLRRRVRP